MAVKRATASFVAFVHGQRRSINTGDLVNADDPITTQRPALFEDPDTYVARRGGVVEQATAAPGEQRAIATRRRSRKTKKDTPSPAIAAGVGAEETEESS